MIPGVEIRLLLLAPKTWAYRLTILDRTVIGADDGRSFPDPAAALKAALLAIQAERASQRTATHARGEQ